MELDRSCDVPDVRSWLYADAWLRETPRRRAPQRPPPIAPFWYREPGLWLPLSCAIANAGTPANPGFNTNTTVNITYDATGVDYAFFAMLNRAGSAVSSMTFNSGAVTFTKLANGTNTNNGYPHELWGAVIPSGSRGSHTLATVFPSNGFAVYPVVWGYSGVDQVNPIGANPGNIEHVISGSPVDTAYAITTAQANSWVVGIGVGDAGGAWPILAGTGSTRVVLQTDSSYFAAFDSGGALGAGAQTTNLTWTNSSGGDYLDGLFVELQVAGGGGGGSNWGPSLLSQTWNRIVQ